MSRMKKQNLEHIKQRFETETGVNLSKSSQQVQNFETERNSGNGMERVVAFVARNKVKTAWVASLALCLVVFGAFGYAKLSDLNGDRFGFKAAYQGDGVVKILVSNESKKSLELQEQLKLMRWSTGEEVAGDKAKIMYSDMAAVEQGASEIITIDLSKAYDVAALEAELPEGDHYYFILTNNDFAFGHDWMCSVDFEQKDVDVTLTWEEDSTTVNAAIGVDNSETEPYVQPSYTAPLAYEDWTWPTVRESVTTKFGVSRGDSMTDHINIQGDRGDAVYAVADGTVLESGFDATYGNYVILDLGDGITVKYGHLKDTKVEVEAIVEKGQKIATMGASGMATGPNLAFFVYKDGVPVNPLSTEDDM